MCGCDGVTVVGCEYGSSNSGEVGSEVVLEENDVGVVLGVETVRVWVESIAKSADDEGVEVGFDELVVFWDVFFSCQSRYIGIQAIAFKTKNHRGGVQ